MNCSKSSSALKLHLYAQSPLLYLTIRTHLGKLVQLSLNSNLEDDSLCHIYTYLCPIPMSCFQILFLDRLINFYHCRPITWGIERKEMSIMSKIGYVIIVEMY